MQRTTSPSARERAGHDRGTREMDAVRLLTTDHREVHALCENYQKLAGRKDRPDPEQRQLLAMEICVLLTVHTRIEEELLYPAARQALGEEGADLLDEAEVEHAGAKKLIRELKAMQAEDELFDAKVKVLGEQVDHHVQEEERELFPLLRRSGLDLDELGARLEARRRELMASPQDLDPLPDELPH